PEPRSSLVFLRMRSTVRPVWPGRGASHRRLDRGVCLKGLGVRAADGVFFGGDVPHPEVEMPPVRGRLRSTRQLRLRYLDGVRPRLGRCDGGRSHGHFPNTRAVSGASAVATRSSALLPSAIRCAPPAIRHWPAFSSKRASSRGSASILTVRDAPGASSTRSKP